MSDPTSRRPKNTAAGTMPAGWRAPNRATTMPANPYPEVMFSMARWCTPVTSTAPAIPAKLPDRTMAITSELGTLIPA